MQAFRFTLDPTEDQARAGADPLALAARLANWAVATLKADRGAGALLVLGLLAVAAGAS